MRIESKLCHVSENKSVVQVTGWVNERVVGSALAEGITAELAEDKAISRLIKRLNQIKNEEFSIESVNMNNINKTIKEELPNTKNHDINVNGEPSDWSRELTAIDSEIERLKWNRDDEVDFLKKSLGYNNRNKITKYNDILKYLTLLKNIASKSSPQEINVNIKTLIEESDTILMDLSWDHKHGREFLQREFNVSTRKELDQNQLISFVSKLKTIRNQYQQNKSSQNEN